MAQSGGQAKCRALGHVGPAAGGLPVLPPPPGPGGASRVPPSLCKQLPCAAPAQAAASSTGRQVAGRPHLTSRGRRATRNSRVRGPKETGVCAPRLFPRDPVSLGSGCLPGPGLGGCLERAGYGVPWGGRGSGRRALEEPPGPSGGEGRQGASCIVRYTKPSHRTDDTSGRY